MFPIHDCPTAPCLALSHSSTPLNTMTASPERTSPFLIATFPTLTARPHHYGPVRFGPHLTIAALSHQTIPTPSFAHFLPHHTTPNHADPKLPRLISPIHSNQHHDCLTSPLHTAPIQNLLFPRLDCPTKPHQMKPHLT